MAYELVDEYPVATATQEYLQLKRMVRARGLLERQIGYYVVQLAMVGGLLALAVALLLVTENPWLQALDALLWAFAFTQVCFVAHDAGHRHVLRTARQNDVLATILMCLGLGASRLWWVDKHNRHHGNPNHVDLDPDVDFPMLAFSEEQARTKRGVLRWFVRYQAWLFVPLLLLEAFNLRYHSIRYMLAHRSRPAAVEGVLVTVHLLIYGTLVYSALGIWMCVAFVAIHQAFLGLYLGAAFANNHKGMPVLDGTSQLDFLRRQVLTSRDIKASRFVDFLLGPLPCQIEHHLFPGAPRGRLREIQVVVRDFCRSHGVLYVEVPLWQSYRDVLSHLHQVGRSVY